MRGDFLPAIASGVGIPFVTALGAGVWKLLSKHLPTPDDFLLAFEFLVAALALQLSFFTFTLGALADLGPGDDTSPFVEQLWYQLGFLVFVGIAAPLAFALGLRSYTESHVLTRSVATNVSLAAGLILLSVFFGNYYLPLVLE